MEKGGCYRLRTTTALSIKCDKTQQGALKIENPRHFQANGSCVLQITFTIKLNLSVLHLLSLWFTNEVRVQ